jgi:pimeloyl-ACP methyl ester carboxylesterase
MNIIKRYRSFQQDGLKSLSSQSQVIKTTTNQIEYASYGNSPIILVSHGSFGGFDLGLSSLYFLQDTNLKFVVPSRFGYLRTPLPKVATPSAQAHAFVELLDKLNIEKVCMVGLSAGGMSALDFALNYPDRCWGLIMISAVNVRPAKTPPIRFIVEHIFTNEFLGWFLATYFPHLVMQSTQDNFSLVRNNPILKNVIINLAWPPFSTKRRLGMINDLEQADHLTAYSFENIICPMLIIHGTKDPFVPFDSANMLAKKAQNARLLALEKGGHLSYLIQQAQSKRAILDFIMEHSSHNT